MVRSATQLAAVGVGAGAVSAGEDSQPDRPAAAAPPDGKAGRVGVISARIQGKPRKINGHTCHVAQYLQPTIDLPTAQQHLDPGNKNYFEMFNMARAFRAMIGTRVEPVPHEEILAVTAMIWAGARSLEEKSRLVALAEVLDG